MVTRNKKFIIITSINPPTAAVEEFSKWDGWTTVVVGDRKSPVDCNWGNVVYLSLEKQKELFPDFCGFLPENTYLRKMIGYLYALVMVLMRFLKVMMIIFRIQTP